MSNRDTRPLISIRPPKGRRFRNEYFVIPWGIIYHTDDIILSAQMEGTATGIVSPVAVKLLLFYGALRLQKP